ncbi:MAG: hypothetical protein AAF570_04175, partial [Bacteroidota bacterium]
MRTYQPSYNSATRSQAVEAENSMSPPQQQWTLDESPSIQGEPNFDACGVSDYRWEEFSIQFNEHFKTILHAFKDIASRKSASSGTSSESSAEPMPDYGSTYPSTAGENATWSEDYWEEPGYTAAPSLTYENTEDAAQTRANSGGGVFLTGEMLSCLFTLEQREMLMDYFSTNVIPDRIFNGDENNSTTAQQRILMAGQILSLGIYKPGSFYQRVHARFCGHWAKMVWHYAGVTPSGNVEWAGIAGNLDHDGNVVLGNGKDTTVFSGRSDRTYMRDVDEDQLGEYLPEGSNFAKKYAETEDEEKKGKMQRYGEMSLKEAEATLKPGDWLYLFNGNSSGSGNHSVIFSDWDGNPQTTKDNIRYRKIKVFSQTDPDVGGKEHSAHIGDEFRVKDEANKVPKIQTVTKVNRVDENAGPADSVLDVLGGTMSEGNALNGNNVTYEKRFLKKHKAPLDREALALEIFLENNDLIKELAALDGDRLTDKQQALLNQANDLHGHVENLVRLNRRLLAITSSVRKHDRNMKKLYVDGKPARKGVRKNPLPGLNEQYEEQRKASDAKIAELQEQLDAIDEELLPTQTEIDKLKAKQERLGNVSEIKRLTQEMNDGYKLKISLPKGDPQRKEITKKWKEAKKKRTALREEAKLHKDELADIKTALGPLEKKAKPLKKQREKIVKSQAEIEATDPWGKVHPGDNKTDVDKTYKFKGDFQPVRPYET